MVGQLYHLVERRGRGLNYGGWNRSSDVKSGEDVFKENQRMRTM
jgi:hypothetical protein